jgi:hypothetical protein
MSLEKNLSVTIWVFICLSVYAGSAVTALKCKCKYTFIVIITTTTTTTIIIIITMQSEQNFHETFYD